jgi:hypothetical protein
VYSWQKSVRVDCGLQVFRKGRAWSRALSQSSVGARRDGADYRHNDAAETSDNNVGDFDALAHRIDRVRKSKGMRLEAKSNRRGFYCVAKNWGVETL